MLYIAQPAQCDSPLCVLVERINLTTESHLWRTMCVRMTCLRGNYNRVVGLVQASDDSSSVFPI